MGKKENERSKNDEVCTPEEVFRPVLDALGWDCFDLDPCSHPGAIVPVKRRVLLSMYMHKTLNVSGSFCRRTTYGSGLDISWRNQRVWLNAPYSQLQHMKKYPWLEKAVSEAKRCVGWLPTRTSSQWWQEYARRAAAVCLWKGRVRHVGEKWGSPFHQALAFWGFNKRELDRLESALDARCKGKHWFMRLV